MRLLLLLKAAAALSSGALPPSAVYKPTQTADRALSWAAALGVFAKLVKRRPAAAVVAGLLTQPLAAGITRDLLRTPDLAEPASLLPDSNSRIVDTDPLEGVRIVTYEGRGAVAVHASHGFGSTSESFQELLEALAAQSNVASVIAHDHPGFGLTKRPSQRRKYMLSGDVALALTQNASSVVFIGHSMGAVSATDAAVRAAEAGTRAALVLIAPAIVAGRSIGPPSVKRRSVIARAVGAVLKLQHGQACHPLGPALGRGEGDLQRNGLAHSGQTLAGLVAALQPVAVPDQHGPTGRVHVPAGGDDGAAHGGVVTHGVLNPADHVASPAARA